MKSTNLLSATSSTNMEEKYLAPSTLKVSSLQDNPRNETDEDLTADDLMSFQWQIACGMVRFQSFSFSNNILLFFEQDSI